MHRNVRRYELHSIATLYEVGSMAKIGLSFVVVVKCVRGPV